MWSYCNGIRCDDITLYRGSINKGGEMKVKLYSNPRGTGWMGWVENCKEQIVGFIHLDGSLVWEW